MAARVLLNAVDAFRKKAKWKRYDVEELEYQLEEFKHELKKRVSQLSEKCLDLGLPFT